MAADDLTTTDGSLDAEAVRVLVLMLEADAEALAEIVDAFLDEAPERLSELRAGAPAGDSVLVGRAAHTLKANAAMFGARHLEALCRDLEADARVGDLTDATSRIEAIDAAWHAARPELVALRERGGAP